VISLDYKKFTSYVKNEIEFAYKNNVKILQ